MPYTLKYVLVPNVRYHTVYLSIRFLRWSEKEEGHPSPLPPSPEKHDTRQRPLPKNPDTQFTIRTVWCEGDTIRYVKGYNIILYHVLKEIENVFSVSMDIWKQTKASNQSERGLT